MLKVINARYSIPTWLWVFASLALAVIVGIYALIDPDRVAPFLNPLPFDGWIWVPTLVIGSLLTMFGMARNMVKTIRVGAFFSFVMWIFGAISFGLTEGGFANVIIFAAPMLMVYAYIYLATYVRDFPRL